MSLEKINVHSLLSTHWALIYSLPQLTFATSAIVLIPKIWQGDGRYAQWDIIHDTSGKAMLHGGHHPATLQYGLREVRAHSVAGPLVNDDQMSCVPNYCHGKLPLACHGRYTMWRNYTVEPVAPRNLAGVARAKENKFSCFLWHFKSHQTLIELV